jgi:hypothetical protein
MQPRLLPPEPISTEPSQPEEGELKKIENDTTRIFVFIPGFHGHYYGYYKKTINFAALMKPTQELMEQISTLYNDILNPMRKFRYLLREKNGDRYNLTKQEDSENDSLILEITVNKSIVSDDKISEGDEYEYGCKMFKTMKLQAEDIITIHPPTSFIPHEARSRAKIIPAKNYYGHVSDIIKEQERGIANPFEKYKILFHAQRYTLFCGLLRSPRDGVNDDGVVMKNNLRPLGVFSNHSMYDKNLAKKIIEFLDPAKPTAMNGKK